MAGAASFFGLSKSMALFDDYRKVDEVNRSALQIDREVQVLKFRVNQYVATGNAAHQAAMTEQAVQLAQRIDRVLPLVDNAKMEDMLTRMLTHLTEYRRQFERVSEERKLRSQLVKQSLPEQGEAVTVLLETLLADLELNEYIHERISVLAAQRSFIETQQNAYRYFGSPDSEWIEKLLAANALAKESLLSLEFYSSTGLTAKRDLLIFAMQEYERTCLRAVQATRGYLYLVHVVMAGEASEFDYSSNQLKRLAEERSAEISVATQDAVVLTKRLTGSFLGIALILGITISGRLAYRIVIPISSLTETFKRLASGETGVTIPSKDRKDELGEMALAATVFSEKNMQTERLLKESQELSDELQEKAEEMEQVNLELDNFAYVASHDLKSPLRGIRQLASWVLEDSSSYLPDESKVHLEKLQFRAVKMESMLNDLLDYSRVGRSEESSSTVDTRIMLSEIIELLDRPDGLEINILPGMPIIETIRAPLEQVFANLLTNAIKHHHDPEHGTIEIDVELDDQFYVFTVRDDGPGIDPKQHQRIFQMYQRVGGTDVEGCGMGLAIIKKQIEFRGGTIRVESEPGRGSAFLFSWPICSQSLPVICHS